MKLLVLFGIALFATIAYAKYEFAEQVPIGYEENRDFYKNTFNPDVYFRGSPLSPSMKKLAQCYKTKGCACTMDHCAFGIKTFAVFHQCCSFCCRD
uniref:Uncharacterized protein n=1 Tax=Steinernema glaseri TaxID=37863 RepID=A0A1I7Y190_9BILA